MWRTLGASEEDATMLTRMAGGCGADLCSRSAHAPFFMPQSSRPKFKSLPRSLHAACMPCT